ncbi:LytTR family DNA-binding domain-containing protein [Emticicia sp. TH156]|uniref:LytR/AlgR family response regulator transcription factor n=1 Tax=Emticicia sp. TH156 TaxID=2067454 RepID=UPI000C7666C4|nr:LytTR family DNA-binding domain-containing protein [Emticicia sp. TH156]PLK43186.1 DNA-binding response regulator [Emticicia sp. TH156]
MQLFNCLIVEDEPLAAEILQDYISEVPFLQLIAVCPNAILATDVLHRHKIDLIFLDINLPRLKGIDFIKTLHSPPKVILTTAYHEYALEGYEHNVLDYLLKPIELSRFLKAVNKVSPNSLLPPVSVHQAEKKYRYFNVNKKNIKIYYDEILYIESQREYIKITTASHEILTKLALSEIEEELPKANFLRVHRSFLVAINKIEAFTATDVEIKGRQIPIGRGYKEEVWLVLGNKNGQF